MSILSFLPSIHWSWIPYIACFVAGGLVRHYSLVARDFLLGEWLDLIKRAKSVFSKKKSSS